MASAAAAAAAYTHTYTYTSSSSSSTFKPHSHNFQETGFSWPNKYGSSLKILARKKSFILKQSTNIDVPRMYCTRSCFPIEMVDKTPPFQERASAKQIIPVQAVSSVNLEFEAPSSEHEKFLVKSENGGNKLKITVEVSGARTQEIFDDVFSKMVAAAQPIPGFKRVKGGKTPDIPKDILLEVLGPSKVYKEVIKKVINSAISEYVKKEKLTVGKNVSVEQSFEDLEAIFEPGDSFQFDAVVQHQQ